MENMNKPKPEADDEFRFTTEKEKKISDNNKLQPWRIIIADDEEEIHRMTKMVLSDYSFSNRDVKFLSAYSGKEAIKLIRANPDTAMILLDVVMETDDSGLKVAKYIRQTLKNKLVRIVLRTGQPGKAPEKKVIMEYDINEYKEKTELTSQKLFTIVTSSLRAYRELETIEKSRKVLELILKSSENIFGAISLEKFTAKVFVKILSLLQLDEDSLYIQASGNVASEDEDKLYLLTATGQYKKHSNQYVQDIIPEKIKNHLKQALSKKESLFIQNAYIGYFQTKNGPICLLYLNGCKYLSDIEKDLIQIFASNMAIVFDNIKISKEILDAQKEIIYTLGKVIGIRSKKRLNHIKRISEFAYLLALKAGLQKKTANLLKLASPIYDVGKIGIPDSILNKPTELSPDEFKKMKTHSGIGYDILKHAHLELLKTSRIVAQHHHERWDGTGYPHGLKGDKIHIFSRIIGFVDVFEALYHKRPYSGAWELEKVIEYIKEESGKHFDPKIVNIFLENIEEFVEIDKKFSDEEPD